MISFAGAILLATIVDTSSGGFSWPGLTLSQPIPPANLPAGPPVALVMPPPSASSTLLETRPPEPNPENWCQSGYMVMIPDGREGRVTSKDGDICKVLAYGEAYVSIWTFDLIEPVYPQELPKRNFGH